MEFAHPQYLWLFLIFIPLTAWYVVKQRFNNATLSLSSVSPFRNVKPSLRSILRHCLFVLRLAAIGCLIIMLARPLLPEDERENLISKSTEGTDIIISLDMSSSMLAEDFKPNRLESAKKTAIDFINERPDDNIGLVVFGSESMTALPLTNDHEALVTYIKNLEIGMIDESRTAIGDGIGTAINAIADGEAKSKSIILLTDGVYNSGLITPRDAGVLAKEKDIKVYTIGIGTIGKASYTMYDQFGRKYEDKFDVVIEEDVLKDISKETGGKYFRATDDKVLADIFNEIDKLEKTEMNVQYYTHVEDNIGIWPWLALGFLLLEFTLRYTVFRTGPITVKHE